MYKILRARRGRKRFASIALSINMGQKQSVFTAQEMEDYADLTYFTKKQVLYCFSKFKALAPEVVTENKNARLPLEVMMNYPELHYNPFGDRICMVFSGTKDGDCTFEDFLDMMSAFCENAPVSIKAEYAFRIFDFDGDDMLGPDDLEEVVRRLLGDEQLPQSIIAHLVTKVTDEADLDDDGMLSYAEFEHAVSKSKYFKRAFRIRL